MYLSKGCKCEVVLCFWFCCYLLLAAGKDSVTDPNEVDALRIIKESLIDINGNLSSWSSGDPCTSKWTGVGCSNTTLVDGYLHVQNLQLLNLNLSGTLAPEIGRLSYLKILNFMWNDISGSIPKEIGNITTLELLLLNGNKLTGPLPEELGYLSNLNRIQIDQNKINGSIPTSFANLNRTRHFHMNNNSLSGQIPSQFSRLGSLIDLLLDNNNLSGYLPTELSEMPSLMILRNGSRSGKRIYGRRSSDLVRLGAERLSRVTIGFVELWYFRNVFDRTTGLVRECRRRAARGSSSGWLSARFCDAGRRGMGAAERFLRGSGGAAPVQRNDSDVGLVVLLRSPVCDGGGSDVAGSAWFGGGQLDNNNFGGNGIPDSYGSMSKLLKLSLRNCNLQGPIPDLSKIPHLVYLDLSSNQLSGTIPPNKLSENITTINLSNNKLTGTIPSYFSDLPRLQKLSIANNSLSGSVSSTIWQNRTLKGTDKLILNLQNNQLTSISGSTNLPPNVSLWLEGNPLCSNNTFVQFCGS